MVTITLSVTPRGNGYQGIPCLIEVSGQISCISRLGGFRWGMIRRGFLSKEDRNKLIALARDGSAASRVTRRANALVLLDNGWSCQEVAAALLLNDDTIRGWHKLFEQRGIEGLTSFDMDGSVGFLSTTQEDALKAFVGATLPRSTRQVGAFIQRNSASSTKAVRD
jgi:transposase